VFRADGTISAVDILVKKDTASESDGAAWRYFMYENESDGNLEAYKMKGISCRHRIQRIQ
jgi:hypothetical protein